MQFHYVPYGGSWLPLVPVSFQHKQNSIPPIGALVDTGATHTILPMELAPELGIELNLGDRIETQVAGGGQCFIYASPTPITFVIRDPGSHLEYRWHGPAYFSLGQSVILLGHHRCLEKFDLTFKGPEKVLELFPRFRTEMTGGTRRSR